MAEQSSENEPDQEAARRPEHDVSVRHCGNDPDATFVQGECGVADDADRQVQQGGEKPAPRAKCSAHQQHTECLAGDWDGVVRQFDRELRGEVDERGACQDHRDVTRPRAHPLADPNRNQEVTDGDA